MKVLFCLMVVCILMSVITPLVMGYTDNEEKLQQRIRELEDTNENRVILIVFLVFFLVMAIAIIISLGVSIKSARERYENRMKETENARRIEREQLFFVIFGEHPIAIASLQGEIEKTLENEKRNDHRAIMEKLAQNMGYAPKAEGGK